MFFPLLKSTVRRLNKSLIYRSMFRQLDKTLPEVQALLTEDVIWLCSLFLKKGFEIRLVGGAVRDMLRKKNAKDIDLSTTATPDQMIELFKENNVRYIETGLQHGTITAHINKLDFEVTTLRIDVETYGRKAKVEFTHDWRLDALRRDLTINALSMDVNSVLYDYFNGEKDLQLGKIRFVGDAEQRIREDYLRILRYFRFYGKIAPDVKNHDETTLKVIKTLTPGLQNIAAERIWMEVNKLLVGNFAPHLVKLMYELDVAEHIGLPSISDVNLREFEMVWTNVRNLNPHPITLLVTLVDSESEAEKLCLKWKLSTYEKKLACFIAKYRYNSAKKDAPSPLKFYQDIVVEKSNPKNIGILLTQIKELLQYEGKLKESEDFSKWTIPKFPVTGGDLKKVGVKQGPDLGKVLHELKVLWMDSYYSLSKEYLLDKVGRIYESIKDNKV